jgi:hypothetical protein
MLDPADFSPIRHLADFGGQNCPKALAAKTRIEEAQQRQTIENFLAGDFNNQSLVLIKQYTEAGSLKLNGEQVHNFLDDLRVCQNEKRPFDEKLVLGIISKTINETKVLCFLLLQT